MTGLSKRITLTFDEEEYHRLCECAAIYRDAPGIYSKKCVKHVIVDLDGNIMGSGAATEVERREGIHRGPPDECEESESSYRTYTLSETTNGQLKDLAEHNNRTMDSILERTIHYAWEDIRRQADET